MQLSSEQLNKPYYQTCIIKLSNKIKYIKSMYQIKLTNNQLKGIIKLTSHLLYAFEIR